MARGAWPNIPSSSKNCPTSSSPPFWAERWRGGCGSRSFSATCWRESRSARSRRGRRCARRTPFRSSPKSASCFLMFSIGLEFSLDELAEVKWVALIGGPLGVVLLSALGAGVGALLGWGALPGLVVGMIVSVASTMVLSRLLIDQRRAAIAARQGDDRHHAGGRPGCGGAHHPDAGAGHACRRIICWAWRWRWVRPR